MRALSIRQPHAEAIMRGVKKIEYRTRPTKVRGKIYIHSSLGRYSAAEEAEMMAEYGIDDVACDDLPRGVILGTVELYDCDGGSGTCGVLSGRRGSASRRTTRSPCGSVLSSLGSWPPSAFGRPGGLVLEAFKGDLRK